MYTALISSVPIAFYQSSLLIHSQQNLYLMQVTTAGSSEHIATYFGVPMKQGCNAQCAQRSFSQSVLASQLVFPALFSTQDFVLNYFLLVCNPNHLHQEVSVRKPGTQFLVVSGKCWFGIVLVIMPFDPFKPSICCQLAVINPLTFGCIKFPFEDTSAYSMLPNFVKSTYLTITIDALELCIFQLFHLSNRVSN